MTNYHNGIESMQTTILEVSGHIWSTQLYFHGTNNMLPIYIRKQTKINLHILHINANALSESEYFDASLSDQQNNTWMGMLI